MNKTPEITIEQKPGTRGFTAYQWSIYPPSSVLAGWHCKKYLNMFNTQKAALEHYPNATVTGYTPPTEVSKHAPAGYYGGNGGFYDAGEYWGEDDY